MRSLNLYCKSYRNDLERAKNLLQSIQEFNCDNIPFVISVPKRDKQLFIDRLGTDGYELICDEDIVERDYDDAHASQQIVKSQYYKTGRSDVVVVIDSDAYFIRPFYRTTYMFDDDTPYTLMHECKDYLQVSSRHKLGVHERFRKQFREEMQRLISRPGRNYDYNASPMIFDNRVWKVFEEKMLPLLGMDIDTALDKFSEAVCYGETILKFSPIPLVPIEPSFKFFHLPVQYNECKNILGMTEQMLAETFDGIVMQSNWNAPIRY